MCASVRSKPDQRNKKRTPSSAQNGGAEQARVCWEISLQAREDVEILLALAPKMKPKDSLLPALSTPTAASLETLEDAACDTRVDAVLFQDQTQSITLLKNRFFWEEAGLRTFGVLLSSSYTRMSEPITSILN